jgi:hypothetical protein
MLVLGRAVVLTVRSKATLSNLYVTLRMCRATVEARVRLAICPSIAPKDTTTDCWTGPLHCEGSFLTKGYTYNISTTRRKHLTT